MPHNEDAVRNVAFFAQGEKFETWKDWSIAAATNYLPPATADYTIHPIFSAVPLAEGMYYYNTTSNLFRVYDGADWIDATVSGGLGGNQVITGLWQFDQMPTVGPSNVQIVPLGGTAGQQLTKVDTDDWNTAWTDPAAGAFDPSFNYSITGLWVFENGVKVANDKAFSTRNMADTLNIGLIGADDNDCVFVGDPDNNLISTAFAEDESFVGGVSITKTVPVALGSMLLLDAAAVESKVGMRNPARRTAVADTATLQVDEGRFIDMDTGADDLTVDQLEVDTEITVTSLAAAGISLLQGAGVTLEFIAGSGSLATGVRTVAGFSVVQLRWRTATNVQVWGNGIT